MKTEIKDDRLFLETDLNRTPEPSSTGKSLLLCSESKTIPTQHGPARVSLNVYIKKSKGQDKQQA